VSDKPSPIDLQKSLGGVDYPATKDQLIEHAKSKGGDSSIIEQLQQIPDREYDGPNAVSKAFSEA
jgi:hypothetical protein